MPDLFDSEMVKAGDKSGADAAAKLPPGASPEEQMKQLGVAMASAAASGAAAAVGGGAAAAVAAGVATELGIATGSAALAGSVVGPIGAALAVFAAFCAFVIAQLAKSFNPKEFFGANTNSPGQPGYVAEQERVRGLFRNRPELLPLVYSRYLYAWHKVNIGIVPLGVTRFRGEEITDENLRSYYTRTTPYTPHWLHLGGPKKKNEDWDQGSASNVYTYDEFITSLAVFCGDDAIIRHWADLLMGLPLNRKVRELYRYNVWKNNGWLLGTPEQRERLRGAQFTGARRAILAGYNTRTIKGTSRAALVAAAKGRTVGGGAKGVRLSLTQATTVSSSAVARSAHTGLGAAIGGVGGGVIGGVIGSLPGAALGGALGAAVGAAIGSRR